jgi:sodium-dependent dicarboxylate transporter 2/3/5
MSANTSSTKDMKWYINCGITVALFFIISMLPPFGQITPVGMKVLAAFVGMLYGWLTVGFAWPSMLGMLFLGLSGLTNTGVGSVLSSGWGNINACILVIMGFAFAAYLDACKLTDYIAAFFLTRKFIDNRPYVLVFLIFVTAFILGAFVNLFAGILVMWAIMYKLFDMVGYERRSIRVAYILGAVIFGAQIGSFWLPFHASAIMYGGFLTSATGIVISFAQWLTFIGLASLVMAIVYTALGKFVLRLDFSAMAKVENFAYLQGGKLTFEQKFAIADLIIMIAILMAPDILPKGTAIHTLLKSIGVPGAFMIAMVIPAIVRHNGKPLMDIAACTKTSSWDVIWLLVATMPIGTAMQSAETGIIATVVGFVMGLVGNMHWITFTIITTVALGLLTQVSHNLILAIVLFGPLATVCQNLGGNAAVWFMINVMANLAAFITPAGSAPSAMYHGLSEWINAKHAYLMGTVWLVTVLIGAFAIGFTVGPMIF